MPNDPLILFLSRRTRDRFAVLLESRRESVLQAAYRVLGDSEGAEDVAQDVFAKLLTSKLDPGSVRSPQGLLVTMAVNAAKTRIRGESRRSTHEKTVATGRREGDMEATAAEIEDVRDAVADLPDALREAVELRYFGGLSADEISTALGVARRTVNSRLADARDRLRGRLSGARFSAIVAGIAADGPPEFPRTVVTPEYLAKLAGLASRSSLPRSRVSKALPTIGAVTLVVVLFAVLMNVGKDGDPNGPTEPGHPAMMAATGTGAIVPADPGAGVPGDGPMGGAADTGSGTPNDPAAAGLAAEATGLDIEVLDELGERITAGEIRIGLHGFMPSDEVLAALRPWSCLLSPLPLADHNPLSVKDLPETVDGLTITLQVYVPGRPPSDEELLTLRSGVVARRSVVMVPAAEIEVVVTDRISGRPVKGVAVISITEQGRRGVRPEEVRGQTIEGASVTDVEGRATLTGLGHGVHTIAVTAEGFEQVRLEDIETGSTAEVALDPVGASGAVVAIVRDPDGGPIAGVRVSLSLEGVTIARVARTGKDGTCRFEGVPPGFHYATLEFDDWFEVLSSRDWLDEPDGVQSRLVKLEVGQEFTARLGFLRGVGRVRGTVIAPDGTPRAGVEVYLSGEISRSGVTDEWGGVEFGELPPGTYRVSLKTEGWGGRWSLTDEIELAEGETRAVTLKSGTSVVVGKVEFPDGQVPEDRPIVSLLGPAFAMVGMREDGTFTFREVPPGRYTVGVMTKSHAVPPVAVEVPSEGDPEAVVVALCAGGRILVTFREDSRARLLEADLRLLGPSGEELNLDRDPAGPHDRVTPRLYPGEYILEVRRPDGETRAIRVEIANGEDTQLLLGAE